MPPSFPYQPPPYQGRNQGVPPSLPYQDLSQGPEGQPPPYQGPGGQPPPYQGPGGTSYGYYTTGGATVQTFVGFGNPQDMQGTT